MKDPAFLFYSQDFLVGTMMLSFSDRGKYITLLALMHQQGRMSEKNVENIIGTPSENLRKKFCIDDAGNWYNKRLELTIEERAKFVESCRINGSKGGRPKGKKSEPKTNPEETDGLTQTKPKTNPKKTISFSSSNKTISKDIVKQKKNDYGFIDSIIEEFKDSYKIIHNVNYEVLSIGKERKSVSTILREFKKKNPEANSEQTRVELRRYFDLCNRITDPWLNQNMSLSIIVSKFNEINNILRNGNKPRKNESATSNEQLANVFAKHFATDYKEQGQL